MLADLPDDVFASISRSLSPRDICNLGSCCRGLASLVSSDKVWLAQCSCLEIIDNKELIEWRRGVSSYKALCRFLLCVKPLMGIWVHQNPELGNVVYAMPGYVSIVGCRIVPQELGELGIEEGPILWAPVFELIGDFNGSPAFFLHGRENGDDYVFPGVVKSVDKECNVLSLEVEPQASESFLRKKLDNESSIVSRTFSSLSRSYRFPPPRDSKIPFNRLSFGDRRQLIEAVTSKIHHKISDAETTPLFGEESSLDSAGLLPARRCMLLNLYKNGPSKNSDNINHIAMDEMMAAIDHHKGYCVMNENRNHLRLFSRKSVIRFLKSTFRHIVRKSPSSTSLRYFPKTSSDSKRANLGEFLSSGDSFGLSLHASKIKLSCYRAWPNMHDSRFALCKLPLKKPREGENYAGLWGGTFGWPPGKSSEDKAGKALFFLYMSYEGLENKRRLIATKILEGTHYVLHPNGSAMFVVNIDEPSDEAFPWEVEGEVSSSYGGEGIANGYGFRYPGSTPGTLFVIEGGVLVFLWRDSRSVLTMQRLDMPRLLKKGERVPPLPPITNFSYLTKSYTNVFAGFSNRLARFDPHSPFFRAKL